MNDKGYTFISVLVSMFVFLVAIVLVWGSVITVSSSFLKATSSAGESEKILQFDTLFRTSISQVKIPFWANSTLDSNLSSRVVIPWINGVENKTIEIIYAEETISIQSQKFDFSLSGVEYCILEYLTNKSQIPVGLKMVYCKNNHEYISMAMFCSWPLAVIIK
jgi:hypothetical protein